MEPLLIACLVAGLSAIFLTRPVRVTSAADEPENGPPPRFAFVALVAALVTTFGAYLAVVAQAALRQRPFPTYLRSLPFVPILDRAPLYGHTSSEVATVTCLLALLETLELVALAALLRGRLLRIPEYAIAGVGCVALLALALASRGLTSTDIYAYVGYATLGGSAYAPPATAFRGGLAPISAIWGAPLQSCAYGPLWLALAHVTANAHGSLVTGAIALRWLGALSFIAIVGCVAALRTNPSVVLLVALNPALIDLYVANGHNDAIAIALTLGAALAVRKPGIAIALAAAAGLVKLPFLAIATIAFAREPNGMKRSVYAAASVAVGFVASVAFGGREYFHALAATSAAYGATDPTGGILHACVGFVALIALAFAIAGVRFGWLAAWSFSALARTVFAWYLGWGLPYAVIGGRRAPAYLASLPLIATLLATNFREVPTRDVSIGLILVVTALAVRAEFGIRGTTRKKVIRVITFAPDR